MYKTRLRHKGQITVPPEIRDLLGASEGDDLIFSTDDKGRVMISRAKFIDPEQAWFWSERWQRMESEVQADLDAGRVLEFHSVQEALTALDQVDEQTDDTEGIDSADN
jgi:AbrB family looped-hinge helix DNA binding protein